MKLNRWIRDIDYNMAKQLIAEVISLWESVHDVVLSETSGGLYNLDAHQGQAIFSEVSI